MQSMFQTGVANSMLVFSGGSLISDFYRNMAVRKHQVFCQFRTVIIKIKFFRENITLSKH